MNGARKSEQATTRLSVRVRPSARRSTIVGFDGSTIAVQLAAPPIDNRANNALIEILAEALDIARSHVRIVRGHTGRHKFIEIDLPSETLRAWLATIPLIGSEG